MLDVVTTTQMMIRDMMWAIIICTAIAAIPIYILCFKIGVIMAKLDDILAQGQANLSTLNTNVSSAVTALQTGAVTQAQLDAAQALADGIKAANNVLAPAVGGPTL